MKAWLAALGLLALVAVAPASAAPALSGGGTTVTVDGATVTITVHIDICCFDDVGTTLVARVMNEVRAAQDMWNKALAKLPAHGCFDVKVVFDARLLNEGDPWNPGYHRVTMIFDKPGRSEVIGGEGGQNDDFVAGYTETLNGTFYGSDMTTGTWAHEIGHLMGLGDDYYEQRHGLFHPAFSCLTGRSGTLMCNDNTGKIDQSLADRLVDILNKDGLLPKCWYGTLKGHSEGGPNNETVVIEFRFAEETDGTIKGSGHVTLTSAKFRFPEYCEGQRAPLDPFNVSIGGRRVGDEFQLELGNPMLSGTSSGICRYPNKTSSWTSPWQASFSSPQFGDIGRPKVAARDGEINEHHKRFGYINAVATIELHQAKQK
jgi:hypothetical protein